MAASSSSTSESLRCGGGLHGSQHRGRGSRAMFRDTLHERTQPFNSQLLDTLVLCRRNPFKAACEVVCNFDHQVRHCIRSLPIVPYARKIIQPRNCPIQDEPEAKVHFQSTMSLK